MQIACMALPQLLRGIVGAVYRRGLEVRPFAHSQYKSARTALHSAGWDIYLLRVINSRILLAASTHSASGATSAKRTRPAPGLKPSTSRDR
ncbi:hypothetical protein PMI27_003854 [Pseudomonas sp. GM41(2012)]|nr:hypothetical protein PMI27_003854 [Pseudomonas sp. GM41(2012)]